MNKEQNIQLAKRYVVDNIYRSAKLEGIGCTFADTQAIVDGVDCANLKPDDVHTIINLKRAWEFLLSNLNRSVGLDYMQDMHQILCSGLSTVNWKDLGKFRTDPVSIGGTVWRPKTPDANRLFDELTNIKDISDPVDRSLTLYGWVARSQAFIDGNKRLANMVANHELIKNSSGIFTIPDKQYREHRQELINFYQSNDIASFVLYLKENCYIDNMDGLTKPERELSVQFLSWFQDQDKSIPSEIYKSDNKNNRAEKEREPYDPSKGAKAVARGSKDIAEKSEER